MLNFMCACINSSDCECVFPIKDIDSVTHLGQVPLAPSPSLETNGERHVGT